MLQLLPAILLLVLHGPATLNRGALSERVPEAIRLIVEMRQPEDESDRQPSLEESNDLAEWLTSRATRLELSVAIAHLLGLDSAPTTSASVDRPSRDTAALSVFDVPPVSLAVGEASKSHPCRAGPDVRLG